MTALEILFLLSGVRRSGEGRWRARCPVHGDRCPSLSICQTDDRVLIFCHAGCSLGDICAALGIDLSDLFTKPVSVRTRTVPAETRRSLAEKALEAWRCAEIRRIAEDLRTRDMMILRIDRAVVDGVLTEEEAMSILGHKYDGYSVVEHRFDCLVHCEGVLELWRESRKAARP